MNGAGRTGSCSGWVSGELMWGPRILLYITVGFINNVHLAYTKFVKQHEIKLSTRGNDAIKRSDKHETYEAAAGVTQHTVLQQSLFV